MQLRFRSWRASPSNFKIWTAKFMKPKYRYHDIGIYFHVGWHKFSIVLSWENPNGRY